MDVRVVAATNVDLERAVDERRFRQDLYLRLRGVEIRLPALAERRDDIPAIAASFLAQVNREFGLSLRGFSREATDALRSASWPGNVRALRQVVRAAAVLAAGDVNGRADLRLSASDRATKSSEPASVAVRAPSVEAEAGSAADLTLEQAERAHVAKVLALARGSRNQAAAWLGVSRHTLYRLIRRHRLDPGALTICNHLMHEAPAHGAELVSKTLPESCMRAVAVSTELAPHEIVAALDRGALAGVVVHVAGRWEDALWIPVFRAVAPPGVHLATVGVIADDHARSWASLRPCVGREFPAEATVDAAAWASEGSPTGAHLAHRDPDLEPILDDFLAERRRAIAAARAAAASGEWASARRFGHQVRGTGTSYGFPLLTALGTSLEIAVRDGHEELAQAAVEATERYLAAVRWA